MTQQYWIETLGCPKNQVDSDKLLGTLESDGLRPASRPEEADVVVVNTCAFVEQARQESIDTILSLTTANPDAELVVTGCLAERYGDELGDAMPEIDRVAGFGVPVSLGPTRGTGVDQPGGGLSVAASAPAPVGGVSSFDLLELPRPPARAPWAYVKIAEGCDRRCGFCAIPQFRGPQRSRTVESILTEVDGLGVQEVVLVAQDLAAFGRDQGQGERRIVELVDRVAERVPWVRLLYLYPSDLTDALIDAICRTGVPYFDLSLQHVSGAHLRRMRRWGDGARFLDRIDAIRDREPTATFRSNFIVGYPGETEDDHDQLLAFVEQARLDWCGFFPYSEEEGTYAADLEPKVPVGLAEQRLAELRELQDRITEAKRDELIGTEITILVDEPGVGRSPAEAPEIDGIVRLDGGSAEAGAVASNAGEPGDLTGAVAPGTFATAEVVGAEGPDLVAGPLRPISPPRLTSSGVR